MFESFLNLFWTYFKIGLFTIGGGYAMLPMVRQQVIGIYVDEELFYNMLAVSEATPGPFAINLATFVGMNVGAPYGIFYGLIGAVIATFAVVLPSLVIIMIVSQIVVRFKTSSVVQGVLYGIRPVVVGLVISALTTVLLTLVLPNVNLANISGSSTKDFDLPSLILVILFMGISFIRIKGKKIHPILLILISAVVGIVLFGVLKVS